MLVAETVVVGSTSPLARETPDGGPDELLDSLEEESCRFVVLAEAAGEGVCAALLMVAFESYVSWELGERVIDAHRHRLLE
jgi:hypothetical protein